MFLLKLYSMFTSLNPFVLFLLYIFGKETVTMFQRHLSPQHPWSFPSSMSFFSLFYQISIVLVVSIAIGVVFNFLFFPISKKLRTLCLNYFGCNGMLYHQ